MRTFTYWKMCQFDDHITVNTLPQVCRLSLTGVFVAGVVLWQVFRPAQAAPAEVPGHQEGDPERSQRGQRKGGLHEGAQTQDRRCKSSLSKTVITSAILTGLVVRPRPPFFFGPSRVILILPFFPCMFGCQSAFTQVLTHESSEKSLSFLLPEVCVCLCVLVCVTCALVPDQRRLAAVCPPV